MDRLRLLTFVSAVCCTVLGAWILAASLRPRSVAVAGAMSLGWYLDESSHTGDLVFFRRPRVDWVHRLVSPLTHVGMIVMHPVSGEPLLAELRNADEVAGEAAGVRLSPARSRLSQFEGALFVAPIARPLAAGRVLPLVERLSRVPYCARMRGHIAKCKLLPARSRDSLVKCMVCSEFVSMLLLEMGVWDQGWQCVTPSDLMVSASGSPAFHPALELE